MRAARIRRLGLIALSSFGLLVGCGREPASFVERVDGVELTYLERYVATEWADVFWNNDGTIDELDFVLRSLRDEDLAGLAVHPKVRILKLGDTAITDAGLAHLEGMTELIMLGLRGTKITDDGLKHLGQMKKLRSLLLARTAVTDDGLRHLAGLESLQKLGLSETAITDAGLRHLPALPALALLYVRKCNVSAEGVAELKRAIPGIEIFTGESEGSEE